MVRNQTDHDLLIKISTHLGYLKERFNEGSARIDDLETDTKEELKDLRKRVRDLENFKWKLIGAAAGGGLLAGTAGSQLLSVVM